MEQAAFKDANHFTTSGGEEFALNLSGAAIAGADFTGNVLSLANFSGATLTDCDFSNADLGGANFSESSIKNTTFFNANLKNASFKKTKFEGVIFSESNLVQSNFSYATYLLVNFKDADLREVLGLSASSFYGMGGYHLNVEFNDATLISDDFSKKCEEQIQLIEDVQKKFSES